MKRVRKGNNIKYDSISTEKKNKNIKEKEKPVSLYLHIRPE